MPPRRGTLLLVCLLLAGYAATYYGRVLSHDGGAPAFFVEERGGVVVMLGAGFPQRGARRFSDGVVLAGVIEMTGLSVGPGLSEKAGFLMPLVSGEELEVGLERGQVTEIKRSFMPAEQRMALGVALHPDRMSLADWQALPGIGEKMAQRIEEDRQENGDFGSLRALERVRGIGPKRIEAWKEFF